MSKGQTEGKLREFFLHCVQKSFWELGLGDPPMIDYVADVLTTFARTDALYHIKTLQGRKAENIIEMLSQQYAEVSPPCADRPPHMQEREFRKYVGDYTLFMSGLFRAYIEKRGVLAYYLDEGRRSYQKVSECDVRFYHHGFLLFQELAKNFEFYSGALDYMRKLHFAAASQEHSIGHFLQQVEGWIKIAWSEN